MPLPPSPAPLPGGEETEPQPNESGVDFIGLADQLPLSSDIGQPFSPGAANAPGGGGKFGAARSPRAKDRIGASYQSIPTNMDQQKHTAFLTLNSLVEGEKVSPWNSAAIKNNVRLMVDSPQAAYILQNPDIIDEWQSTIWSHTMASLSTDISEIAETKINDPNEANAKYVRDFFSFHDGTFSTDERGFLTALIAAMPDAKTILVEADVQPEGEGLWNTFKLGWRTITRAPEAIRPAVNDPRKQLMAELHEWLKEGSLETLEDKQKFMLFAYERAQTAIQDVSANASGFFALAEASVSLPFTTFGNEYNDWVNRSSDPNHFASKQHLSLGQTTVIGMGINPGEDWYTTASGFADGMYGIFTDPLNLAAGVGTGIKNAAKVPRAVSVTKADAFRDAFRLFGGGRRMNLPVFDRGIISRFTYAAFSRDVDQMMETRNVTRLIDRLSGMSSPAEIVELMPAWRESEKLVKWVAETSDKGIIKELLAAGLKHPESIADDSPLLAARTSAELTNALDRHIAARQEWLDAGGSLQGLSTIDEVQDILRVQKIKVGPEGADVEALQSVMRRGPRLANSPIVAEVDIKDGRMVIRGSGDTIAGFDAETQEFLGMIERGEGLNPLVGTALEHQERGVFSGLKAQIPNYGANRLSLDNVSDQAKAAQGLLDNPRVFVRSSELTGDGEVKFAVSTLGAGGKAPMNLSDNFDEVVQRLDGLGLEDDAIKLSTGQSVSQLSEAAQDAIVTYADSKGHSFVAHGGEMIVTDSGQKMLVRGVDEVQEGRLALEEMQNSYTAVMEAQMRHTDIHAKMNPRLWVVKDTGLQFPSRTKQIRMAVSSKSNGTFMRQLRRSGFRITHRLPTNISLVETGAGSQQLRNWVKALGGTDELANKWSDAFRAGNASTRKNIILEALEEVGEEIGNPMLKSGLLEFGNKQGQYTYFYDRAGRELGLGKDGSIQPMSLAHFADNFAMPDAKTLLRSLKRYGNGKVMPGTRRGILPSTRRNRRQLAANLRQKMQRLHGVQDIPEEDLYAMAYADILGGEYGRATGMGAVAKAAGLTHSAYKMLHNVFVIGQLAFRPIAWASRVLIEETVRADLMGLPSIWRNPYDWAMQVADASAIRRLPQQLQAQGEIAEGLVNNLFLSGKLDEFKAKRLIPNLDDLLDQAGVAKSDTARVQAFLGAYVGQELSGLGVTAGELGQRGNITRRAIRREKQLRKTFEKMDVDGLGQEFRWDIDGQDIANRSFWAQYMTEAEAATVPLEYTLGAMTPKGLRTYGYAYGRQVYQMAKDPIVASYGFSRAIANALGQPHQMDGARLVGTSNWPKIKHIVDRKLEADGLVGLTEVQKADWYLTQVDEIVSTLFDPLATRNGQVDLAEKARILRGLRGGGTTKIEVNGVEHVLNAGEANYLGFVKAMANVTEGAYAENRQLPTKIAAFLDPRFGQEQQGNGFRRFTDMMMRVFGEEATQKLNRQPAYRHVRGRYFRYYKDMGWETELARTMAAEKAAELTNYIFFDNKTIPAFLKDMNEVVPFFSAMWEVGSTWLYKIPSHNIMPVGYAQLGRRTHRAMRGLMATGLVEYDPETNQMNLNVSRDMLNAEGPIAASFGRTLYEYMRLPVTLLEFLGGVQNLITEGEFETSDFDAWAKDGYSIAIGNPLDPTSHGLMAVNQFSVGASPVLQLPISMGANAVFAQDDEKMDVEEGTTIGAFIEANPDLDIGELLRVNEQAFIEANGAEVFKRALSYDFELDEIVMPTVLTIPGTSTWEMLINRTVFPFGKTESLGEVITAASPGAMNHVWRGMLQKFGGEGADEIAGMLFGQMSSYSMASEVLTQIQMIEASDGSVSRVMDMVTEVNEIVERLQLDVIKDEEGVELILNAESEEAQRAQELFIEIAKLNATILRRANNNAAGSSIMRGIMGQLGPVTPRMWVREQEQVAAYWATRDMALEAQVTGSKNVSKLIGETNIQSAQDMVRLAGLSEAWLNDKTGDEAKIWMAEQNPALSVFAQGKSYWGPAGPPPAAKGFDKWVEQVESGDRQAFSPEVFMARYQRTGIAVDREIAIINRYGNDPDAAATAILQNYDEYNELVDPFNREYDALEFLDAYLYDGKYAAYRRDDLDDLTTYELLQERLRDTREEIDVIQDMLIHGNLQPDEERRMLGIMNSHFREYSNAVDSLKQLDDEDGTFLNPREQVLDRYFDLSNEYYQGRNEMFAKMGEVQDKTDRAILFEAIRVYDDNWYNQQHTIEGHSGSPIVVPAPQVRSWNGLSQLQKQERILSMVGKKPEWLSQFEMEVLLAESPAFAAVMPITPQQRQIYDEAAMLKWNIRKEWASGTSDMTKSQRDTAIGEVQEALEEALINAGRGNEVAYMDMVPFMRLDAADMLPDSLRGIVPVLNGVLEDLKAIEKSPKTNDGYAAMMQVRTWLETSYFLQQPNARGDIMTLGSTMFGEAIPSAVYAKLLQGDFFGELG